MATKKTADDNSNRDPRYGEEERDITTSKILPASQFRSEKFAQMNIAILDEYADYRVMGWNPERAFLRVFGTDYGDIWLLNRIDALEHNLIYRKLFASKFGQLKLDDMWNAKYAAYELISLVNNPFTKCSTRLAAIKDLNTLYGIVVADPNGNQTPGRNWTAFYEDQKGTDRITIDKHPTPGTPEATAFVSDVLSKKD